MTQDYQGKVALVTGGSSGIGYATAKAFAAAGAKVVIASRREAEGCKAVRDIEQAGGQATWIEVDVAQDASVRAMIERAIAIYGRLDFAFNNAGSGTKKALITEIDEADFDREIGCYLKGVWLCMKYEIPQMLRNGGGAIVNNSSVDGLRGFAFDGIYSAAKHGVIGLTKSAALQFAAKGVRINAICPGWVGTPAIASKVERDASFEKWVLSQEPIGRMGKPEEIAATVLWLCSEGAGFFVGSVLAVDGGYMA